APADRSAGAFYFISYSIEYFWTHGYLEIRLARSRSRISRLDTRSPHGPAFASKSRSKTLPQQFALILQKSHFASVHF
ncbi:hypothetical protein QT971_25455, partial [Microcoleus sp. herbarium19]|uniref:hypothetical protein n=1 Tax=Microcoleus sp. herbarium19 TaxID=3055440 RepID=UPI002FCFC643